MTGTETGHKKGLLAEKTAAAYFMVKGYKILAERFRTRHGEVDLILEKNRTLVFVEVKARKTADAAAEAIHARNQTRVRQAAELYLQRHPSYDGYDIRFDAFILAAGLWPQHIENAF